MKKLGLLFTAFLVFATLYADEGMWLLQLMHEQQLEDQMKKQGLQISIDEIYNPNGVSLKDAVGIFGGGCTGEIISPEGLLITNHHCGYSSIQSHSSVEHNYLKDGFWAMTQEEELPTENLTFTMVEQIADVTDSITALVASGKKTREEIQSNRFLDNYSKEWMESNPLKGKPGISARLQPYYAGNKYYMVIYKKFSDIRMVAAPPSSIGKFGNETDNWMWPRHTGDFSVFRIYADKEGNPAEYSPENVPLKCQKYLSISLKGVEEGDFAMILGFPGSTSRYLTRSEVENRMYAHNAPRIRIRDAVLKVLREEMAKDEAVHIQYASTFAGISNYWKNSIGMNKALIDNKVLEGKSAEEERFRAFAHQKENLEYITVIDRIDSLVRSTQSAQYDATAFNETFGQISFGLMQFRPSEIPDKKDEEQKKAFEEKVRKRYDDIHNSKVNNQEIQKKIAKVLLPLYAQMVEEKPDIFQVIEKEYENDFSHFVDDMYDNSILSNQKNLEKFLKKPTEKAMKKDLGTRFFTSVMDYVANINSKLSGYAPLMNQLHQVYVKGLCEMYAPAPKSADANFTLRLTYGNVKPYNPRDGVSYHHYTTLDGVMEKEDTTSQEFTVPEKLKELYRTEDYGRYAMPDGKMPVCFLTTNDITGGNSGSPVINGRGELLGLAFDGNWESLSGDIHFEPEKQRCISVDIRYVLFIIEKLGDCQRLIDEMTIVE